MLTEERIQNSFARKCATDIVSISCRQKVPARVTYARIAGIDRE